MTTNYMKDGRDPGWIELFFDLSYVVMLGRLAHLLFHAHHGVIEWVNIFDFIWIFQLAFIMWMYFTVFMNIYGNDSFRQNNFAFILMIGLFTIVLCMHDIEHMSIPIAVIVAMMAMIIGLKYQRVKESIPDNERYAVFKSKSLFWMGVAILPVIVMPHTLGMIYVSTVLVIEHILDEVVVNRGYAAYPDGKHFVERIGIFMIILFGESLITLANNLPHNMTREDYSIAGMLLFTVFALWINYFAYLEHLTEIKYHRYSQILLTNMFVMIGITLLSAIIYHALHQELSVVAFKVLIVISTASFYIGNGVTYFRTGEHSRRGSLIYAILPVLLVAALLWVQVRYVGIVFVFFTVNIATALFIYFGHGKLEGHS